MAHMRSLESTRKSNSLDNITDGEQIKKNFRKQMGEAGSLNFKENETDIEEALKDLQYATEEFEEMEETDEFYQYAIHNYRNAVNSFQICIRETMDRILRGEASKKEEEIFGKVDVEYNRIIKNEEKIRVWEKAREEARIKAEQEAKAKAEKEARIKAEQEAKAKAEEEARIKAEQEAKAKAEKETRIKAEQEAKAKAEEEARIKAEQEAKAKAEEEAKIKAEQEAKAKAEEEARIKAEQEAKAKTTMMEDGLYTFSPEEIAMATASPEEITRAIAKLAVHEKESMGKSEHIDAIKNAIKNGLTPEEYKKYQKKFATAVNQEYEEPTSEKYRPEDESIKDEVGDEFSKAEEGNDSRNTQEIDLWMNRFNKWYTVLDKVSDKAKAKFIQMKSDIVRTIRGVIKERANQRDDNVQNQDTNER